MALNGTGLVWPGFDSTFAWLEGAAWFHDTLVDADLAANTLGWQ